MPAQATIAPQRTDFYPPRPQGTGRAMSLALMAHLLLAGALTWGVSWKREATISMVEAELWSSLPQEAAPKPIEAPPPAPKVQAPPEPPPVKAPDIAVEKVLPKPEVKPPPIAQAKPEQKPEVKPPIKAETKPDKALEEKKLAEQRENERLDNLKRMEALAGATGESSAQGSAKQTSGPSRSYAAIVKRYVKPHLTYSGSTAGNLLVSVEVRLAFDGTVLGEPRVIKSSGNKDWDEAVVRAFQKVEIVPRDEGKVWTPLVIEWRMRD